MGCANSKATTAVPADGISSADVEVHEMVEISKMTPAQLAALTDEEIALIELGNTKFFKKLKAHDITRDYTLIVDKSGSMESGTPLSRWKEAEEAVKVLAPAACKCDPDGITLYFFSGGSRNGPSFKKHCHVKSDSEVMELFNQKDNRPDGSTGH